MCVLTLARDRIHAGWRLLTHPLYGNIQPFQQPYRSVLLGFPYPGSEPDHESLSILEKAILLFTPSGSGPSPLFRDQGINDDYASLDVYLMRESMERYGILKGVPK